MHQTSKAISRSENQCGNPDFLHTSSFSTGKHLDHVSIDETSSNWVQAQLNISGRIKALSFQLKFSNSLPDRLPRFRCATRHWFYLEFWKLLSHHKATLTSLPLICVSYPDNIRQVADAPGRVIWWMTLEPRVEKVKLIHPIQWCAKRNNIKSERSITYATCSILQIMKEKLKEVKNSLPWLPLTSWW